MSAGAAVPRDQALRSAFELREMFYGLYERWEFGGSVRRGVPTVNDVEHVVVPLYGMRDRMDELVRDEGLLFDGPRPLEKSIKADGRARWGKWYRAVAYQGVCHEVWMTETDRFGATLAIRTGPSDLSVLAMTRARSLGMHHRNGVLLGRDGEPIATPEESDWFAAIGFPFVPPEERAALARDLRRSMA